MFTYNCLNPIAEVGLNKFNKKYEKVENIDEAQAILVRSATMHDMEFGDALQAIARAGAGVNNIPLEKAADKGIVVFNTPGANANGVKELVIAGMLLASRDIVGGIKWVEDHREDETIGKDAEKAKKAFAGQELEGKKLGVIGLGAIGVLVANVATHMGMEVYGYDPFISVESAWKLSRSIKHIGNVEEIYKECDYITIHVPAIKDTIGMINKNTIAMMKNCVKIINFSRDALVNTEDMIVALEAGEVGKYVTDFPIQGLAGVKNTIVIPHLGASTEESEDNCAMMAVNQVVDYLENGNIKNSVNYPDCDMGRLTEDIRVTILHKNIPNMIGQFTKLLAEDGVNIANMTNKSRSGYAYTMLDIQLESDVVKLCEEIEKIPGVLKVRKIG
ncbi:MAG: phosphoglycerate dehydrogenase [Eubacteriales bacterium]